MIKRIGSQNREPIEDTEYTVYKKLDDNEVILVYDDTYHFCKMYELWIMNDHFSGYVVEIEGKGYEFTSSNKDPDKL